LGFSGATRCCAGSFTELMPGDVQNDEAPTLFRERLEIGLDRNLDGLITGKNLDANRRIAKVNLVASSALSSNDGYGMALQSRFAKCRSEPVAWDLLGCAYCRRLPVQRSSAARNGQWGRWFFKLPEIHRIEHSPSRRRKPRLICLLDGSL
jgi:hypothetical protein